MWITRQEYSWGALQEKEKEGKAYQATHMIPYCPIKLTLSCPHQYPVFAAIALADTFEVW
jgi:hypothetical protein